MPIKQLDSRITYISGRA